MRNHPPIATRVTLLARLKDWEDEESWRTFVKIYGQLIHGQAKSAGLSETEADEVMQETLIVVAHRIKTFTYNSEKGSFKGWLFRLTRWRIVDQFNKRQTGHVPWESLALGDENLSGELSNMPAPSGELGASWERDWQQTMLDLALEKLRLKLPAKHFQVFQMLVQQHQSVPQVAGLLRCSQAYVHLVKFRGLRCLKKELARLDKDHI